MLRSSIRSFSTSFAALKIAYKKPILPYQQFYQDNFDNVKQSNPGKPLGQLSKLIASRWQESESVKQQYQADYDRKLEASKNKDPELAYAVKPLSPFQKYSNSNFKKVARELKTKNKNDISKVITKNWNELPESEKEKQHATYKKALARYKREDNKLKGIIRPASPYVKYLTDFRNSAEAQGLTAKEIIGEGAKKWNSLSDSEKAPYEKLYAEASAKYKELKAKTKRPLNKYSQYVKEKFSELKNANPDAPNSEIFKLLGEEWKFVKDTY